MNNNLLSVSVVRVKAESPTFQGLGYRSFLYQWALPIAVDYKAFSLDIVHCSLFIVH